jgi:nicotinamide mononucleotide transporter
MIINHWLSDNYIEVFGAIAGIIYVFLEIRQTILLWPVGIITSAVYIWVFFTSKFYADMSLQWYYLIISCIGWYWWAKGAGGRLTKEVRKSGKTGTQGEGYVAVDREDMEREISDNLNKRADLKNTLQVTRLKSGTAVILIVVFVFLYAVMFVILSGMTDSPVPGWDSFITSLSIVATWMLARKIYEHWFLWIVVNSVSAVLFFSRELYPTVILYVVYGVMSLAGLVEWKKTICRDLSKTEK